MIVSGWGNFPKIKATIFSSNSVENLKKFILLNNKIIAFGNGRSYGDSALNNKIIKLNRYNHFLKFDKKRGFLELQAGALISEVLELIVPHGWFLPVTPGTKFITIGGAIASDVHGKNHHRDGCFSSFIKKIRILGSNGQILTCSKKIRPNLFKATCGGMGLTGLILDAEIELKKIKSKNIISNSIPTKNLSETFKYFEEKKGSTYSVAWIDCFARIQDLGRGIFTFGEFANDGDLKYTEKNQINIPFYLPRIILNNFSIRIFNLFYYLIAKKTFSQKIDLNSFFYPLDRIGSWNRLYGEKGFLQYQCIFPKKNSYKGIYKLLELIRKSKSGSFLCVLKLHGKENKNWLSFPIEGYSLALDFKYHKQIFKFFEKLDEIVIKYNGRIYLSKDARISKENFEKGYPLIKNFRDYRKNNFLNLKFESLQSKRLKL